MKSLSQNTFCLLNLRLITVSIFFSSYLTSCLTVSKVSNLVEAEAQMTEGNLVEIDSSTFASLNRYSKKPVLVEFTADWCVPCQKIESDLWFLSRDAKSRYIVARLDVDKNKKLASKLGVYSLPTFFMFSKKKRLFRYEGAKGLKIIDEFMRNDSPLKTGFQYKKPNQFSSKTKVFLIAASQDSASFAEEVIHQRSIWSKRGFKNDEIACYYIKPNLFKYYEDRKQFDSLREELKGCYEASMKILKAHIKKISNTPSRESVILYATSHGISKELSEVVSTRVLRNITLNIAKTKRCKLFDTVQLVLDTPNNESLFEGSQIKRICESKTDEPMIISPKNLRTVLGQLPESRSKTIILQGCFSGGFIDNVEAGLNRNKLTKLGSLTLLTASRRDRTSFGCNPGAKETIFGGLFNLELNNLQSRRSDINWNSFYRGLRRSVDFIEARIGVLVHKRSKPQYFSNVTTLKNSKTANSSNIFEGLATK